MWAAICFTGAGAEMTPVKISMPTDDRSKLGRELVQYCSHDNEICPAHVHACILLRPCASQRAGRA